MSALLWLLFAVSAAIAIYSIYFSVRDYFAQVRELFEGNSRRPNSYAVWPTRLRLREDAITGVPQVLFRRRPKPFTRKVSWRSVGNGFPRVTRRVRYAAAPERVIVLN